ncbi:MAG: hypothetical protein NTW37_15330 [Proteobacteria bacterium]|nr:hypothetical protein [Pseudomonadota bacterium]
MDRMIDGTDGSRSIPVTVQRTPQMIRASQTIATDHVRMIR